MSKLWLVVIMMLGQWIGWQYTHLTPYTLAMIQPTISKAYAKVDYAQAQYRAALIEEMKAEVIE